MKAQILLTIFTFLPCLARAADVTGIWKAEFDTQIGVQKYTYTLKQDGAAVTGKATSDIAGEKHESALTGGRLDGDKISFVEVLSFQGNDVRITYAGIISDNEIKFTREVGEFAKEELVAKRVAPPAPERSKASPKTSRTKKSNPTHSARSATRSGLPGDNNPRPT